ncbi:MAG: RNA polymerase sigma factor [Oscillospiraceae bacterium]
MHDDNLNEIIKDFKRGNSRAFNQIYSQTHRLVYKCAFSMLKNENDANDVVQNVYIKVYDKIGNLRDESKFQSWLMSVTYNEAKNLLSSQKKYTENVNCDIDISENDWISLDSGSECSFENDYIERETNDIIKCLIDNLPGEQKEVLMLYYFEEKDVSSIANILKCPKGTVKSRLNYSRKSLKKSINQYEERNQIKLHSGIAALINIECMNKIFRNDIAFKTAVAGIASVCAVTYGVTVFEINQNDDINNVYNYEYVSDTEETTETTTLITDITSDESAEYNTEIPVYETEKYIEQIKTQTYYTSNQDLPETVQSEIDENNETAVQTDLTEGFNEEFMPANDEDFHIHEENDEIKSYFYKDNRGDMPYFFEDEHKSESMPPYFIDENNDFNPEIYENPEDKYKIPPYEENDDKQLPENPEDKYKIPPYEENDDKQLPENPED